MIKLFFIFIVVAFMLSPIGIFLIFLLDVSFVFELVDMNPLLIIGNAMALMGL